MPKRDQGEQQCFPLVWEKSLQFGYSLTFFDTSFSSPTRLSFFKKEEEEYGKQEKKWDTSKSLRILKTRKYYILVTCDTYDKQEIELK